MTETKVYKLKITTMRRPDGGHQYKITLPKDIVEDVRHIGLVAVGTIYIGEEDVVIDIEKYMEEHNL